TRVEHRPSYALAIVDLESGESVKAETGAMVSMSGNVRVESGMQGGLFKSALRKVLGGESFFVNTFTADGGPGEVTFAPSLPGDVDEVRLNGELYVQSGSYLAGGPTIDIDIKWGGARSFFAAEGLFLLHLRGQGEVMLSSFGAIHRVELDGARSLMVDTGHVVAFEPSVSWDVRKVSGLFTSLISGEGLVVEFSGRGKVWLQTRSNQAFLDWLLPRLPTSRTSSGGRGDVGGILGNILRGS
ncbi:MAG TPA: TIGR00266 family protein, partial [Candidatus Polarisedimenticolaceae bacterium]|nr:TIGR00266 family protein [Candidatus Polarisedimenticolaceae bacterium]